MSASWSSAKTTTLTTMPATPCQRACPSCCSQARCTRAHPGCWRWGREEGASAGGLPTKALAGKRCEGLQDGDAEKAVPVRPQHHNTRSEARLLRPCSVHGSRAEATTQIWRGLAPPPICPDHQLRQLLQSIRPPLEADALDPGRGSLRWRPLVVRSVVASGGDSAS